MFPKNKNVLCFIKLLLLYNFYIFEIKTEKPHNAKD